LFIIPVRCKWKENKLEKPAMRNKAKSIVVDPDPVRTETFRWIRMRLIKFTITQQMPVEKNLIPKIFPKKL
jgi:hypothetical protein